MSSFKLKLIKTADGSHSLYREDLNETYHSKHGAEAESRHVFIKNGLGLFQDKKQPVQLLEVGFGTGLNALLTLAYSQQHRLPINYHTLEPFPLDEEVYNQLNFSNSVELSAFQEDFIQMHACEEKVSQELKSNFAFQKYFERLEDFQPNQLFDLIYFDAFAPNKQADVWEEAVIKHAASLLNPNGVLVTYCAQGQFKRNLKSAGLSVETLSGPPPKKEMTRGWKES